MTTVVNGVNWTYSGDPSASTKDAVRNLVNDTNGDDPIWSDDEIIWAVNTEGDQFRAAALIVETALMAGRYDEIRIGDLQLGSQGGIENVRGVIEAWRARAGVVALPFAGGISVDRKEVVRDDDDRVTPAFRRGQFDHPDTYQDGDGENHYRHFDSSGT